MSTCPYTILPGDTFDSLCPKLGLTVDELEAANPDLNPHNMKSGEILNIPGGSNQYTIMAGDKFSTIGAKFSQMPPFTVSVELLKKANPSMSEKHLQPGQCMTIPAGCSRIKV